MIAELESLEKSCQTCQGCSLSQTRTKIVFSDGKPNSKLMLIGEAPGFNEDQQGKPFVGRAGKLLDKIFESVGLTRQENLYICNTLKCRPPENRNPLPEEKKACWHFLEQQIALLRPRIIILCGKVAVDSFLTSTQGISKIRGQWFEGPYHSKMMPIFHPAYLLRSPSKAEGSPKWLMWQDVKKIKKAYDELP